MDKISKSLQKLSVQEQKNLKDILTSISKGDFSELDLKKLKARKDIFRVRAGKMRIIFYKKEDFVKVLSIERRSDKTYR